MTQFNVIFISAHSGYAKVVRSFDNISFARQFLEEYPEFLSANAMSCNGEYHIESSK
jgi:hypothetical protein